MLLYWDAKKRQYLPKFSVFFNFAQLRASCRAKVTTGIELVVLISLLRYS